MTRCEWPTGCGGAATQTVNLCRPYAAQDVCLCEDHAEEAKTVLALFGLVPAIHDIKEEQ